MEVENSSIPAEENKGQICPLCRSQVKYFFLNFNEKLLICENIHCEFPFGYQELQFLKEDEHIENDAEVSSLRSSIITARTYSLYTPSTAAWSEVERIERINYLEDKLCNLAAVDVREYIQDSSNTAQDEELLKIKQEEEKLKESIDSIKSLNTELALEKEDDSSIKNEKWIKDLNELQNISGLNLVKPEELKRLRKDVPIQNHELKIEYVGDKDSGFVSIQIKNSQDC